MVDRGSAEAGRPRTTIELEGDRGFVIRRRFNGPARIVFDAWTKPELVRRWWAPAALGVKFVSCDADVRVGGTYRYVIESGPGQVMAFAGTYRELTPFTRLVHTQYFEPTASGADPDDEPLIVTVTFDERDGRTDVVSRAVAPTPEIRDAIIASGMEHGVHATWDQLDDMVATMG
jgi:uncharacterized protein YndB with AHSA1/START domain